MTRTVAIVGSVGVPALYGGFETLVENLLRYRQEKDLPHRVIVFCSGRTYEEQPDTYLGAELRYVNLDANGVSSIPYDILSLIRAGLRGADVIVLLGVSGAMALPLFRLFFRGRVITNVDGVEWKREKWKGPAKLFLRWSERAAVRWSHTVIADNKGIADYIHGTYGVESMVIAYGGDHALAEGVRSPELAVVPERFFFSVCRIEPENNVGTILEAFSRHPDRTLVFVGNWERSEYSRALRRRFASCGNLMLLDPIYDLGVLAWLRRHCSGYLHGHSAGGTNPSLVEAMQFGVPVIAYDCVFNRHTMRGWGLYFRSAGDLSALLAGYSAEDQAGSAAALKSVAEAEYTWDAIGRAYFRVIDEAGCGQPVRHSGPRRAAGAGP